MRPLFVALALILSLFSLPSGTTAQTTAALAGASRPKPQMQLSNRDRQYKRIHQFALRLILLLRFDEARDFLTDHLNDYPDDEESHYLMGMWHARQGHTESSAEWFGKAIKLGLPEGRVLAGPRGLLRNIDQSHPFFADLRSKAQHALIHGPLVGKVTHNAASFWVRTAQATPISVVISRTPDFAGPVVAAQGHTRADADYTGILQAQGLQPNTRYHYQIQVDGVAAPSASGSFHTFAAPGSPTQIRLAFGGGSGFVPPNERAWDTIRSYSPDLLLLFGDNVYIDDPESIIMQRYTYHRRQSRPEWRHLTAQTPVFSIWDDHDFGTNDCWGGPAIDAPFWKPHFAFRTFRENWVNPGYAGGDEQPGCWYRFQVGDIDFVMLDCRYYRTSPTEPHPTMLGPVQKRWLKATLRQLSGTFKVICSSVPWDYRTKGDSRDTWNGYRDEREEIFSFLEAQRIEGVLLMSADRHRSDAWRIDRPNGYSLYEFNSSRLTNQHVHPEMTDAGALFSYNKKQSFGIVDLNTEREDPTATYSVVTIDGEIVHEVTVNREMLGHK